MSDVVLWILVAGGLLVGELLTLAAVAGLLAGGAGLALASTLLTDSLPVELGVFAVSSVVLLALVRPTALRQLRASTGRETSSIVGAQAVVVQVVGQDSGQVRLNGELWRARPEFGNDVIEVGAQVLVHAVDGATVHVLPLDPT